MQTGATMPEGVPELLRLGPKIAVLPVIHGSGQCALTVRRWMLEYDFDCVAVPLPASFQEQVEEAVLQLPQPGIVIQPARQRFEPSEWAEPTGWTPEPWSAEGDADWSEEDEADGDEESVPLSYVPIDPCQPVIMAIRAALGEHVPRAFVDLETDPFMPMSATMPEPYAFRPLAGDPSSAGSGDPRSVGILVLAAWRARAAVRPHLVRLQRAALAFDPPAVPGGCRDAAGGGRCGTAAAVRARSAEPAVSVRRDPLHHRSLRTGSGRVGRRREPLDRRRQAIADGQSRCLPDGAGAPRPADHPAAAFAVPEVHPQSIADRAPHDARPVHDGDRVEADLGRPVCPPSGGNRPRLPLRSQQPGGAVGHSGHRPVSAAGRRNGPAGQPLART